MRRHNQTDMLFDFAMSDPKSAIANFGRRLLAKTPSGSVALGAALLDFASKPTAACAIGHFVEMLCTTGSQDSCSLVMKANVSSGVKARV